MNHNLSRQLREIISFGMEEARRSGSYAIGVPHLLLGLIRESDNNALELLTRSGIQISALKLELLQIQQPVESNPGRGTMRVVRIKAFFMRNSGLPLSPESEQVLRDMIQEAKTFRNPTIDTEHLLLAILKNKNERSALILAQFGLDYEKLKSLLAYRVKT